MIFGVVGIAAQVPFFKGGLDKLGVRLRGWPPAGIQVGAQHLHRTGLHQRRIAENLQTLVDGLFGQMIEDVARDRNLPAAELRRLIDSAPLAPPDALSAKLVDKLGYRDEVMAEIERRAGRKDSLYEFRDYLEDSRRTGTPRRGDRRRGDRRRHRVER